MARTSVATQPTKRKSPAKNGKSNGSSPLKQQLLAARENARTAMTAAVEAEKSYWESPAGQAEAEANRVAREKERQEKAAVENPLSPVLTPAEREVLQCRHLGTFDESERASLGDMILTLFEDPNGFLSEPLPIRMLACMEDELHVLQVACAADNADVDSEILSRILLRMEYRCRLALMLDERFQAAKQPAPEPAS